MSEDCLYGGIVLQPQLSLNVTMSQPVMSNKTYFLYILFHLKKQSFGYREYARVIKIESFLTFQKLRINKRARKEL